MCFPFPFLAFCAGMSFLSQQKRVLGTVMYTAAACATPVAIGVLHFVYICFVSLCHSCVCYVLWANWLLDEIPDPCIAMATWEWLYAEGILPAFAFFCSVGVSLLGGQRVWTVKLTFNWYSFLLSLKKVRMGRTVCYILPFYMLKISEDVWYKTSNRIFSHSDIIKANQRENSDRPKAVLEHMQQHNLILNPEAQTVAVSPFQTTFRAGWTHTTQYCGAYAWKNTWRHFN